MRGMSAPAWSLEPCTPLPSGVTPPTRDAEPPTIAALGAAGGTAEGALDVTPVDADAG
jgi:hypothetical protein